MNYKQEIIRELADSLVGMGFRVYLSFNGEYGFYTDDMEETLVSFQTEFFTVVYSGNYVSSEPRQCGQGWRMDGSGILTKDNYQEMLTMSAPGWAHNGFNYQLRTVAEHVKLYSASKYAAYTGCEIR